MILLTPQQTAALYDWFVPDRPGPLVGLHVIQTGQGVCYADRWSRSACPVTTPVARARATRVAIPVTAAWVA